jgi:cyclophilin family peptidyl-prolyl cis-trans isomerase
MPVQRLARAIRGLFRQAPPKRPSARRARPQLLALEERCVPAFNPMSVVTGSVYVDSDHNGVFDSGDRRLPGVPVTLTGTSNVGAPVNMTAVTDVSGTFRFRVDLGSYEAIARNGTLIGNAGSGVSVVGVHPTFDGQFLQTSIGFIGLSQGAFSLRRFLASTPPGSSSLVLGPPGTGGEGNSAPTIRAAIGTITVTSTSTTQMIDLAGVFTDRDLTTSRVRMVTSKGNINLTLFDGLAPRTVANYYDYILHHKYDSSIFHRLGAFLHQGSTTRDVLQGGDFTFSETNGSGTLTKLAGDNPPTVADEVNLPNTAGTIAMAKTGLPNSATSEFFFNLIDNTNQLSVPPQTNGGFTVFGRIDPASQPVLNALAASHVEQNNSTITAFDSSLTDLPLRSGAVKTNFPAGTVATDYALVKNFVVLSRNEYLTYSLVSNSNNSVVTAAITDNRLTLTFVSGHTGSATITLRATDRFGAHIDTAFIVNKTS